MSQPTASPPLENQSLAYSQAYQVLGNTCLHGPQAAQLPYLKAMLAQAALPEQAARPQPGPYLAQSTPDELAADHYQVFGLEIHPFESAFLEPEGLLGGAVTESVTSAYREAGFDPHNSAEAADHLGWELLFLSGLCEREARAAQAGLPGEAARLRDIQFRFLDLHLLRWLPGLVLAVRRQTVPLYGVLVELALALASAHYAARLAEQVSSPPPFTLPAPPALLAESGTRLRDIAAYLLTPAHTGLYFSRLDIQRLAQAQGVPRGFGERQHMLSSLLRNAAEYDQFPRLAAALSDQVAGWQAGYAELAGNPDWGTALARFVEPWAARTAQTAGLLDEIGRLATAALSDDSLAGEQP